MKVKEAHQAAMDCRDIAHILRHGDTLIPPVTLSDEERERAAELLMLLSDILRSSEVSL